MAQNDTFSPIDDLEAISQLYGPGVCFGQFLTFLGVFERHGREAVASSRWAGPHENEKCFISARQGRQNGTFHSGRGAATHAREMYTHFLPPQKDNVYIFSGPHPLPTMILKCMRKLYIQ